MTFLNLSLLLGVLAVGVPIALHLIARKEPRMVTFPSVRLLTQRFETHRSKIRIRRWWLLALRIAAIAAVALALARPVVSGADVMIWVTLGIVSAVAVGLLAMASVAASSEHRKRLATGLLLAGLITLLATLVAGGLTLAGSDPPGIDRRGPVALAVVVDNGPLSFWRDGDQSLIQRMRRSARQLMLAVGSDSRFAVVDRSSTPVQFALDLSGALSKVDSLSSLEVAESMQSRMDAALRLLDSSDIESKQLVILSVFAESSFPETSLASLKDVSAETGVTLWDLGPVGGRNRRVSLPVLSDNAPAPESSITLAAVASLSPESSGDETEPSSGPVRVTAECVLYPSSRALPVVRNGQIVRPEPKPVDRVSIELDRGRDVELSLTLPPLPLGLHHGAIRLVGDDALPIDDLGFFTVTVLPPSSILLVADNAEEAVEIARAVSAPQPIDDPAAQYQITRIGYSDLAASRIGDFDGVVLLDPPNAALEETELVRYLDGGGSVLIAAGPGLGSGEVELPLGVELEIPWRVPPPGTFLQITSPSHPAIASLASIEGGVPFQDFRINQYWKTQSPDSGAVLLRYAGTGHPAIIDLSESGTPVSGQARRIVLTTPLPELADPATAWNELFSGAEPWPAFVLVRDLVRYLSGRSAEDRTVSVGAPVSITLDQRAPDSETRRLQWFPPRANTPVPIEVQSNEEDATGRSRILIGRPRHSGVHWIRGADPGLGFTANVPRDALSAKRLSPEAIDELFSAVPFQKIDSFDQMEWNTDSTRRSVPLWSPLMLLALLIFLLEQILGNRFYRSGVSADPSRSVRGKAA